MNVSNQELQAFTLDWCNQVVADAIRKAQGMSLHRSHFQIPRVERLRGGHMQDSSRCVIARTLAEALGSTASVSEMTQIWMLGRGEHPWGWNHPDYIDTFIQRFDGGAMPELDLAHPVHQAMEQDRLRRESRYKEWQNDTRAMQAQYKGFDHKVVDICDIPVEPMVHYDWSKELGLEGVAAPETV